MNTKLTLTIEKEVIEKAKKYAKQKGRSLSDIVENYLRVITVKENTAKIGSGFNDLEDALQNFSAIKSGFVSVILTRNVKDYKGSTIGVLTPENYLKSFSTGR